MDRAWIKSKARNKEEAKFLTQLLRTFRGEELCCKILEERLKTDKNLTPESMDIGHKMLAQHQHYAAELRKIVVKNWGDFECI